MLGMLLMVLLQGIVCNYLVKKLYSREKLFAHLVSAVAYSLHTAVPFLVAHL